MANVIEKNIGLNYSSALLDSRAGDETALEALFVSTNGPTDWNNTTGWATSGMSLSNSIYGVEVENIGGELRVTRIKLNGTTTYEVDDGTNLKGSDGVTGGNGLTGTLPTDKLGNLKQMEYFNVKQNAISGSIPGNLLALSNITHILLNGRAEEINYDAEVNNNKTDNANRSNTFTGQIADVFPTGSNLKIFEIFGESSGSITDGSGYPGLDGVIPDSILNCTGLLAFGFGFNSITDFPANGFPPSLRTLYMNRNAFKDTNINGRLDNLTNIYALEMSENRINGAFPDLTNSPDLRILWSNRNDFTGPFPSYLLDDPTVNPNLRHIEISWANFDDTPCPELNQDNMVAISLNGCSLTNDIPASWGTNSNGLINFGIGFNSLTGQIPDLDNKYQLRLVYLFNNSLTGTLPNIDGTMTSTNELRFDNNDLSGYVDHYQDYADLAVNSGLGDNNLDISGNGFSDSDIQDLRDALSSDGNLNVLDDSNQTP